ncbi:MAG: DNA lyase [Planctomycetia bacterium]|nr:DNA lyase [Planctomycetia bacterium]
MRLWSLHPSLLDARGLVAVWREALLAQNVIRGKTNGYRHHPQLARFKRGKDSKAAIACYLRAIYDEAERRGYSFNGSKIIGKGQVARMAVKRGQLAFEWAHLKSKVRLRDPEWFEGLRGRRRIRAHPLFVVVPGDVEPWERGQRLRRAAE